MFELGDKVIYQGADKNAYKRHGVVKSIEDRNGKPQLTVAFDDGETFTAPIDDWSRAFSNSCTSSNSVVRNAMAARKARNEIAPRDSAAGKEMEKMLHDARMALAKAYNFAKAQGLKEVADVVFKAAEAINRARF